MKKKTHLLKNLSLTELYNELYSFYGPQHWWPGDTQIEIAVGAILTQNTAWSNVEKAICNLKKHNMLNAELIYELPVDRLAALIRSSGYYNIKAKRIKAFIEFLFGKYDGSMMSMKEQQTEMLRMELLAINGIGQETADSILLYALNKPVFVVDAYTKRILSRHGIMDLNDPYKEYQKRFHHDLATDVTVFNEYHALLVRVGKEYCGARPLCKGCPLAIVN